MAVKAPVLAFTAAALALFATLPAAHAGTPWWCTCHGEVKRFVASSRICERGLEDRTGRKIKQCSRAQFLAWNRKACLQEGCAPRQ